MHPAERGTFVYRCWSKLGVGVRRKSNVGDDDRTGESFAEGDLVSVDLVQPSANSGSKNGPFLRLSDETGWIFEKKHGEKMMEEVRVDEGLWAMYADNCNSGIALRCHPFDNSPKVEPQVLFRPMQKIYCDRRVVDGRITAYRVQGTKGWVFDKRFWNDGSCDTLLLPESEVEVDDAPYVFRVVPGNGIMIRKYATVDRDDGTGEDVSKDDLVACNAIRKSQGRDNNGPYVRLNDGSGWLFEHKSNERMLSRVPVEAGTWKLKVENDAGIALRTQPMDDAEKTEKVFKKGQCVVCDRKVRSPDGAFFYRVEKTDGWIFDKRPEYQMAREVENNSQSHNAAQNNGWNIMFLRGLAEGTGLHEIAYNPESRVISFASSGGEAVRINVYYTTRTVGTALVHPTQGKTQMFRRDCSNEELKAIFRDPRVQTGKGFQRTNKNSGQNQNNSRGNNLAEQEDEEELRHGLRDCDTRIAELEANRTLMVRRLKTHDDRRTKVADAFDSKRLKRERQRE